MTEATYLNVDNNIHNTYNAYISYDLNGNITGLDRNGGFEAPMQAPAIDQLKYFYKTDSNQLQKVTDLTNDHQGFKDDGNGTLAGDPDDDYDYDAYGNMTKDQNKGITHIRYNHMNLPTEIDFANNQKITYLYSAMGTKLQKTIDYGSHQVVTDYRDGYQYETKPQINGGRGYAELLFFPTAEGYVKALYHPDVSQHEPKKYQYIYIYKDHLGNNRLSYTLDPETHQIKILEENHYYPFGLKHGNYNAIRKDVKYQELAASKKEVKQVVPEALKFKYLYNGKELQDELSLNIYDYGARTYDPAAPRFWQVDPDAEKYQNQSVYVYADDNPVRFMDIDGKGTEDWYEKLDENGNGTGEVTWFDGSNEIEGYKHIGYDYVVTNTDVNGNRTQIKYDGDTKSSYIYNMETGKFEFLKNYDYSDSGNLNKIKSFAYDKLNGPLVVSDQLLKSLIVGFQGAGIAMYEGIVNKKELDGINLTKLGYKPIMNIERTLMYNNGKWVYVNLHSQGNQAFFKEYTKSLIKITPASKIIKVVKNKYINMGIISILKKKAINWLDNQ